MNAPVPVITFIGPENVLMPGKKSTDRIQVMHFYNNSRIKKVNVTKFAVCTGVYNVADIGLLHEIVGIRQPYSGAHMQAWTVDSFEAAGYAARANHKSRSDLVRFDIDILEFVYREITSDWVGVKSSDRFDAACEILHSVVGHVWLGRTDARKRVRELLKNAVELRDKRGRLNPQGNSRRIHYAIPQLTGQTSLDILSTRSLENALGTALLLQQQVAGILDFLKYCVATDYVPTDRRMLNSIYANIDIKPYSFALSWVRAQKTNRTISLRDELILLSDALGAEYRLSLISTLCGQLKNSPDCFDKTIAEIVSVALINRADFPEYQALNRILKRYWESYKKMIAARDTKSAKTLLETMQRLVRFRMVEVLIDGQRELVQASGLEGHCWHETVLEYVDPLIKQPSDPFVGLP